MHRSVPPRGDEELAALVTEVRASAVRMTRTALDELASVAPESIESMSLRRWPPDFPNDVAMQRRAPYESRADSVMYLQVLAEVGTSRGWAIHHYDDKTVEADAAALLGARADDVLHGPRARLGAPWAKDHRMALAATVLSFGDAPAGA